MIFIENPQYECHEIGTMYFRVGRALWFDACCTLDASILTSINFLSQKAQKRLGSTIIAFFY